MDIATVAAALEHDSRFAPLIAYLEEKLESAPRPLTPAPGEEVIPSSATVTAEPSPGDEVEPEGLIERTEDEVVEIYHEVEAAVAHAFDPPEPPASV